MIMKLNQKNYFKEEFGKLYSEFYNIYKPYSRIQIAFSCVDIFRKFFFILVLVYMHDNHTAQTLSIALLNAFYLLLLLAVKPYLSPTAQKESVWNESL